MAIEKRRRRKGNKVQNAFKTKNKFCAKNSRNKTERIRIRVEKKWTERGEIMETKYMVFMIEDKKT